MNPKSAIRRLAATARRVRNKLPEPVADAVTSLKDALPASFTDKVMGRPAPPPAGRIPRRSLPKRPPVPKTPTRLYIGPANFAGQGYALARAVERELTDVGAVCFGPSDTGFSYPVDYTVPRDVYMSHRRWQNDMAEYVAANFTHVLIEAQRALFAARFGHDPLAETRFLSEQGIRVATLAHGTDVRIPSLHAERYPFSPFHGDLVPEARRLEARAKLNLERLTQMEVPAFVTTPDLLEWLPRATWCPVVVDPARWHSDGPPLVSGTVLVAHAPSKGAIKGSDIVDPLLEERANAGGVAYRRVQGVNADAMPDVYRDADIVLDQFRLGSYGVAACEAMAAGRVVLGNVTKEVRAVVRSTTGLDVPIVQCEGHDVVDVIEGLLADPDRAREIASRGPQFVAEVHDGRRSATVLRDFLTNG